ncbi:MAG: hypothetical protein LBN34_07290 [Clostridiales Family XIII bacterium]|nr:hypothetical protein [Clostridiales Family XIII bacterium]
MKRIVSSIIDNMQKQETVLILIFTFPVASICQELPTRIRWIIYPIIFLILGIGLVIIWKKGGAKNFNEKNSESFNPFNANFIERRCFNDIINELQEKYNSGMPFAIVTGKSGSGKSSLVKEIFNNNKIKGENGGPLTFMTESVYYNDIEQNKFAGKQVVIFDQFERYFLEADGAHNELNKFINNKNDKIFKIFCIRDDKIFDIIQWIDKRITNLVFTHNNLVIVPLINEGSEIDKTLIDSYFRTSTFLTEENSEDDEDEKGVFIDIIGKDDNLLFIETNVSFAQFQFEKNQGVKIVFTDTNDAFVRYFERIIEASPNRNLTRKVLCALSSGESIASELSPRQINASCKLDFSSTVVTDDLKATLDYLLSPEISIIKRKMNINDRTYHYRLFHDFVSLKMAEFSKRYTDSSVFYSMQSIAKSKVLDEQNTSKTENLLKNLLNVATVIKVVTLGLIILRLFVFECNHFSFNLSLGLHSEYIGAAMTHILFTLYIYSFFKEILLHQTNSLNNNLGSLFTVAIMSICVFLTAIFVSERFFIISIAIGGLSLGIRLCFFQERPFKKHKCPKIHDIGALTVCLLPFVLALGIAYCYEILPPYFLPLSYFHLDLDIINLICYVVLIFFAIAVRHMHISGMNSYIHKSEIVLSNLSNYNLQRNKKEKVN